MSGPVSTIAASVFSGGNGNSGEISITGNTISLLEGGTIRASVEGINPGQPTNFGTGGEISITLDGQLIIDGFSATASSIFPSGISNIVGIGSRGNSGSINLDVGSLTISNVGMITASHFGLGEGDAGDIAISAAQSVDLDFGFIQSIISPNISGDGGNITIAAQSLSLNDGATVTSENLGNGNAGNIEISLDELLLIDSNNRIFFPAGSEISTSSEFGSGGRILIDAGDVRLFGDSDIRTRVANGVGSAGNITIKADTVVALDDSDILAFAADGRGGDIDLSQTTLFSQTLNPVASDLSREELLALDGNDQVDINATGGIASGEIFLSDASFVENSLNELSDEFGDTTTLTAGSCIVSTDDDNIDSFVITGSEGLAQKPGTAPLAVYPTDDIQSPTESTASSDIQEPHGVYRLADGRLVLSHECGG